MIPPPTAPSPLFDRLGATVTHPSYDPALYRTLANEYAKSEAFAGVQEDPRFAAMLEALQAAANDVEAMAKKEASS